MLKRKPQKQSTPFHYSRTTIDIKPAPVGELAKTILGSDVEVGIEQIFYFLPQKKHPLFLELYQQFSRENAIKLFAYTQIAKRFMEMPSILWHERLRCLLARWNIMNELLYLEHQFDKPNSLRTVESITTFLKEIEKDEDEIWNFIANFAFNPESYPEELRERLQSALSQSVFLYGMVPGHYAFKLSYLTGLSTEASEKRWEDCLWTYNNALSAYRQLHELLATLLEQSRNALSAPVSNKQSTMQRSLTIQAVCDALRCTKQEIERLHKEFMFKALLPKTSPYINYFVYDPQFESQEDSKDSVMITSIFMKLVIAIRNQPQIFANPEFHIATRVWLSKPERLSQLSECLLQTLNHEFGVLSNHTKTITDSLKVLADFPIYKPFFEFQKVLVFFFKLFENSTTVHEMSFCHGIVFDLWQYHLACMDLMDSRNCYSLNECDRSLFRYLRTEYFATFYEIHNRLINLLSITLNNESQNENNLQKSKNVFSKFDENMLKTMSILQNSVIEMTLENKIKNAELLLANIDVLTGMINQQKLEGNSTSTSKDSLYNLNSPVYCIASAKEILAAPPTPCLQLARTLRFTVNTIMNVPELASPNNLTYKMMEDILDAANAVLGDIIGTSSQESSLSDIAGKVEKIALKLSHGILSGNSVQRLELAKRLALILEECLKRTETRLFDQYILKNALEMLHTHIIKIKHNTYARLVQFFTPKVEALIASLEEASSLKSSSCSDKVNPLELEMQCPVFLELLEKALQRKHKWNNINYQAVARLFVQLAQTSGSENLQCRLFILFITSFYQHKSTNRADLDARYTALHHLFLAIPLHGGLIKNPRLKKTFLSVLEIFCKEALHWSEEGESRRADIVLFEAKALQDALRAVLTPEEASHSEQLINTMLKAISSQKHYSELLTFLKNPHQPHALENNYWPLTKEKNENNNLLEQFQSAWYALSFNSGMIQSEGDARALYRAWFAQFKQCRIKTTKEMLQMRWTEHYQRFLGNMPQHQSSELPAKRAPVTVASRPVELPEGKKVRSSISSSRLRAIELYNQKSMERSLSSKPSKPSKPRRGEGKKGRKPRFVESASAVAIESPVVTTAIPAQDVMRTPALVHDSIQSNMPLASSSVDSSLCQHELSEKSSLKLPEGYQNPAFVQKILEIIEGAGYQAYIIGGFVRDTLLGLNPNDVDLITNCPVSILPTLFSDISKSKTFDDVFHITNPDDQNQVVDITCRIGDTLKKLLSQGDFTVNCLGVNSKSTLLIPYHRSITDFNQRKLRTLISFKKSIEIDPVRLMRLIRLSNQLGWELDLATVNAIPDVASHLASIPLLILVKHIRKCFPHNINVAMANLDSFLQYKLFPAIFGVQMAAEPLPVDLSDFIKRAFLVILTGKEYEYLEDILAVSSLTLVDSSTKITQTVKAWLARVVPQEDRGKARILMDWLPKKIAHYHAQSPLNLFNPCADTFDPVEALKQKMSLVEQQSQTYNGYSFFESRTTCVASSSSSSCETNDSGAQFYPR
ncbi:CCA tRNA nucleotidyltransferase [Legionella sp. km535]|uniref:CCA tRNA nucleotidyltransferase n=1 Tax=Legionella sp. km535 TaxID=2498107 RepID=UPI000F8DA934|nr:CCA tRNA nucleotidyltransferase [Legionella sp. km535]RUR15287.1 CCA tRNA nucleotidyltransferase [Legionella sp. km535]